MLQNVGQLTIEVCRKLNSYLDEIKYVEIEDLNIHRLMTLSHFVLYPRVHVGETPLQLAINRWYVMNIEDRVHMSVTRMLPT